MAGNDVRVRLSRKCRVILSIPIPMLSIRSETSFNSIINCVLTHIHTPASKREITVLLQHKNLKQYHSLANRHLHVNHIR